MKQIQRMNIESYIAILLIAFIICFLLGKSMLFHHYLFCELHYENDSWLILSDQRIHNSLQFLIPLTLFQMIFMRICAECWIRVFSLNCSFSMKICTPNQCTHCLYGFSPSLDLYMCMCMQASDGASVYLFHDCLH